MMDPELLVALKALSDASRLRIVGLLAGGRRLSVEELADALSLAPGTVVHHLRRLRDAGLVTAHPRPPYVEHELRLDRLASIGGELDRIGRAAEEAGAQLPGPDGEAMPAYEAKVLRAFLVDGRLVRIPAQHKKRQVILRFLARTDFRPDEEVPEREVNMRLALRHPDVASLRRYLVESGYMERGGGIYRLRPNDGWPTLETTAGDREG
jgi:ArsR family transcriptional regulator, arsenate/arsenite/antimonite-responsive transcriptional repressor